LLPSRGSGLPLPKLLVAQPLRFETDQIPRSRCPTRLPGRRPASPAPA